MQDLRFHISDKITLREAALSDAGLIFHSIDTYRDDLREWLPFVDSIKQTADEEAFISSVLAMPYEGRNFVFVIESEGMFCGLIGFVNTDVVNHKTEIGYWLLPPFRGRGIITKCTGYLCNWAFSERGMNRVQIKCAVGNYPSNAVPVRLNFKKEGIERAGELLASGAYADINVYSVLKSEYL